MNIFFCFGQQRLVTNYRNIPHLRKGNDGKWKRRRLGGSWWWIDTRYIKIRIKSKPPFLSILSLSNLRSLSLSLSSGVFEIITMASSSFVKLNGLSSPRISHRSFAHPAASPSPPRRVSFAIRAGSYSDELVKTAVSLPSPITRNSTILLV